MPSGHFDYQYGDKEVLDAYKEQVATVSKLIEEVFVTNRVSLLSPVIRELVADAGKRLSKLHSLVGIKLIVDNPGEPLKEQVDA